MMKFLKILFRILLALVLFPIAGFVLVFLNYHIISFSVSHKIYDTVEDIPSRRYALVMGAGNYKPRSWTNHTFNHRIQTTVDLYETGKIENIIASGVRLSEDVDEVTDMQLVLTEKGVPSPVILTDRGGNRTFASVERVHNYFKVDSIIIISQHGQLERALFIARCVGLHAIGLEAEPIPRRHKYWTIREYLARVKCIFDCIAYHLNFE